MKDAQTLARVAGATCMEAGVGEAPRHEIALAEGVQRARGTTVDALWDWPLRRQRLRYGLEQIQVLGCAGLWRRSSRRTASGNARRRCMSQVSSIAAAFSAIIIAGAEVLPPMIAGMTDASATRKAASPWTHRRASVTAPAAGSVPIAQLPTG